MVAIDLPSICAEFSVYKTGEQAPELTHIIHTNTETVEGCSYPVFFLSFPVAKTAKKISTL